METNITNFRLCLYLAVLVSLSVLPAFATTRRTAIELNNDGIHAVGEAHWSESIDKLTASLLIDPSFALARANLATVHNNYGLSLVTENEHESFRQFHYAVYFESISGISLLNLNKMAERMGWNSRNYADRVELGDRFLKEGDIISAYVEYTAASKLKNDLRAAKTISTKLQKLNNLLEMYSDQSLVNLRTSVVKNEHRLLPLDSAIFAQNTFMVVLKLEQKRNWNGALKLLQTYYKLVSESDTAWIVLLNACRQIEDHKQAETFLFESEKIYFDVPSKLQIILKVLMDLQIDYAELEDLQNTRRLFLAKFPDVEDAAVRREELAYCERDFSTIRKYESGASALFSSLPVMPIKIYIGPAESVASGNGLYTKLVSQKFYKLTKNALNAWSSAANNRLIFNVVDKPAGADIRCEWTTDETNKLYSFTAGETTSRSGPTHDRVLSSILIYLDAKRLWSDQYFYEVCLHELGHALGLPHSTKNVDVMYWGVAKQDGRVFARDGFIKLSNVDIERIRAIYNNPFEAKKTAFAFAQSAYIDAAYEKAYRLLSLDTQKKLSFVRFRHEIEATHATSRPKVLQMYSAEIYPNVTKIGLIGTNGAYKSYYYMELVRRGDGRFEVADPQYYLTRWLKLAPTQPN